MSHPLSDAELLTIWERGQPRGPSERALLAICASDPSLPMDEVREWSLNERDARLLSMHIDLCGPQVQFEIACPRCGARLEFGWDLRQAVLEASPSRVFEAQLDGLQVRVRMPSSADVMAIEGATSVVEGEDLLWRRCVSAQTPDGTLISGSELTPVQRAQVERSMDEAGVQSDVHFDLSCAECGASWDAPLDAGQLLWMELARSAQQALIHVDALARRYGWSEAQILGMSPRRRELYLAAGG